MKYQTVMVTPEKAKEWLQRMGKNRKLSPIHVNNLAVAMKQGHWVLNGQTISFSAEGKLLDGQHRLNAVIQSGMTVPMAIAIGVTDDRAFESYDIVAKKRGVDAIIGMEGVKHATHLAAVARRLLLWERCDDKTKFSLRNVAAASLSPQDVLAYLRLHLSEIQTILNEMLTSLPCRRCAAGSAFITALILCNRVDDVSTLLFMEGLKTGVSLPVDSPVYLLREKFITNTRRRGIDRETEVMALTIKAWNKYTKGQSMKLLRWTQDREDYERFPVPGGK